MEEKKTITLDLTGCKYLGELHERIRIAFDFPEWYGANWDAFWDSLTYESPVDFVEIRGEGTASKDLRPSLEKMHEILEEAKQKRTELGWEFDDKIVD